MENVIMIEALTGDWERPTSAGKAPVSVVIDGQAGGLIAVTNTIKPDSSNASNIVKNPALRW